MDRKIQDESSDHRDLLNFGQQLEKGIEEGLIPRGAQFWLFTDDFAAERACFKGMSSSSGTLFCLAFLQLRKLEMKSDMFMDPIWCART